MPHTGAHSLGVISHPPQKHAEKCHVAAGPGTSLPTGGGTHGQASPRAAHAASDAGGGRERYTAWELNNAI